eukprot:1670_1
MNFLPTRNLNFRFVCKTGFVLWLTMDHGYAQGFEPGGVVQWYHKYNTRHRAAIRNMRCRPTLSPTFLVDRSELGILEGRAASIHSKLVGGFDLTGSEWLHTVFPMSSMFVKRISCDLDITFHSSPTESPAGDARTAQSLSVDFGDVIPGSNWSYSLET